MTPAARIAAAIEALADIVERRRPAADALKDWGLAHRFAGSKDRAAIASLVYDALRRKASAQWLMGAETARAAMLGALRLQRGLAPEAIGALCSGERHAPEPLTEEEARALAGSLDAAPPHVRADAPEWAWPKLEAAFGEAAAAEIASLGGRAPVDIRANDLKIGRDRLLGTLAHLGGAATPLSPDGIRFQPGEDGRGPSLQAEKAFLDGLFEIQDEGSQLVARLSGAAPGEQVVDLCAGGGGKTLALAALMQNRGQLFATDSDARRLAPIYERLKRSGARNTQVLAPRGRGDDPARELDGQADLVFVDAPCTGSGTWRRNPDAKWRLRPGSLEVRLKEQITVLDRAARLAKPGGRLAYVTCSVLPDENDAQVRRFLTERPDFAVRPLAPAAAGLPEACATPLGGLQLTPLRTGTDGFYLAMLARSG